MPSKVDDFWPKSRLHYMDVVFEDEFSDAFDSPYDSTFQVADYEPTWEEEEDVFGSNKKDHILLYDCMWTGCDEDCRKGHVLQSTLDLDNNLDVLPSSRLSCSSDEEDIILPYTPSSDHCYSQPKRAPCFVDKDSSSSEDEVDVVTVTEERVDPYPLLRKRRRPRFAAKSVESAVKAALKKCGGSQRRRPAGPGRRRGRKPASVETSPSSSMPSSCGSSRCSSDVEEAVGKRSTHNTSERRRREAQRDALQMLRVSIPELQENPKAPKVVILNTATRLIRELESETQVKLQIKRSQLKKRRHLQKKLKALRQKLKQH